MLGESKMVSISLLSWAKLAFIAVVCYVLFQISGALMTFATAIVIATAIEPFLKWAEENRVPRLLMAILVYVGAVVFFSFLFYFLLLPLIEQVSSFVRTMTIYTSSVSSDGVLSQLFSGQKLFGDLESPLLMSELNGYLNSFSNFLSQGVFSTASNVFGGVLNLFLIVVMSFYLAVQQDAMGKLLRVVAPISHEQRILALWHRSKAKIGLWMQGQLLLGVFVAVMVFIALTIFGVPNALLFAVLSGVFEIIPIFGPILSALPAVFSAYSFLGGADALMVLGIYFVIQQLENHVFYPMVVKKVVGVPPIISIIALVVGGQLGGFLGVVIAVPVAIVILEILEDFEKSKLALTQKD